MQFLLIAYDGTDTGAQDRRMKSRAEHLEKIAHVKKAGRFLFGGAILDDHERMIGSMILYEVTDREELDKLLLDEPFKLRFLIRFLIRFICCIPMRNPLYTFVYLYEMHSALCG